MNKQEYIEEIRDTLTLCAVNGMHLGEVNKAFVKIKTEKIFLLFLDMAESMILESKTLHGNFHTYTCDHIDEESEIKHPIQVTHQCFVVDQFKEKIEELRGGENNE